MLKILQNVCDITARTQNGAVGLVLIKYNVMVLLKGLTECLFFVFEFDLGLEIAWGAEGRGYMIDMPGTARHICLCPGMNGE